PGARGGALRRRRRAHADPGVRRSAGARRRAVVNARDGILERLQALLAEAAALGDAALMAQIADLVRGPAAGGPATDARADGEAAGESDFHGIIGTSAAMAAVYKRITKFAAADAPVMITGESGTGKEMV